MCFTLCCVCFVCVLCVVASPSGATINTQGSTWPASQVYLRPGCQTPSLFLSLCSSPAGTMFLLGWRQSGRYSINVAKESQAHLKLTPIRSPALSSQVWLKTSLHSLAECKFPRYTRTNESRWGKSYNYSFFLNGLSKCCWWSCTKNLEVLLLKPLIRPGRMDGGLNAWVMQVSQLLHMSCVHFTL